MTTGLSAISMDEAEVAIKSSQSYQAPKVEQTLNSIGNKALAVSGSEKITMTQNAMAGIDFSLVKDEVSNFVENSKMLVSVLDEIGKAHPFVQAAVVVFKAGIQLELTRRENDERVLALNITMCDMMSVLRLLKKIASPKERASDGITIEERLHTRMKSIVESIKSCAKLCDSYQRRHSAVKFFTSLKWQSRFAGVAEQFVAHQDAIQSGLQIYISVEITNANNTLSALNKNVNAMMEMVFERMQSPEEREIARIAKTSNYVQSKEGGAVLPDDKLLKELVSNQRKDEKVPARGSQQLGSPLDLVTLKTLKAELTKDVDKFLEEDSKRFDRAFEAIEVRLGEVKGTIIREGDRVIETILAGISKGPHERIVDRDIYHVWQEMGWRGSVKATHFVMAIHDHFSSKSNTALNEIQAIANGASPTSAVQNLKDIASIAQQAIPATPAEDLWSLKYISVRRAQPLIEALDDDGSSFITVNEVNTFTTSRPEGWSLPRWIAYWTIGFEMTTQWYYRRIRRLFSLISDSSKNVLPANRNATSQFMKCWSIDATEDLLAGLQDVDSWDDVDWVNHNLFRKFRAWELENERKMDEILRKLVYYIDQDNTLNTVTGGGRPERYMMPLFYLLLKRSHSVMERAHDVVLHPDELNILDVSLSTVHYAVRDRVEKLQAIYKLQNIKKEDKLQNIFFGLYAYTFETPQKGDFWMRDIRWNDSIDDAPPSSTDIPEPDLYFGPQDEELDLYTDSSNSTASESPVIKGDQEESQLTSQAPRSLVGAWSGNYSYWSSRSPDGPVSFSITQHTPDDRFQCSGVDTWGPFTVHGRIDSGRILFLKDYAELQRGTKVIWRYEGLLNEDRDEISGNWGLPLHDEEEALLAGGNGGNVQAEMSGLGERESTEREDQDAQNVDDTAPIINIEPATPKDELDEENAMGEDALSDAGSNLSSVVTDSTELGWAQGTFVLNRRPAEYALYRPSDEEFQENKPRALWTLVRNAVRYWFRVRNLTWEGIRERRDKRRTYLGLLRKMSESEGTFDNPADRSAWAELVRVVHPNDLHLWHNMAQFENRREPVHLNISCDYCSKSALRSTRIVCIECSKGEFLHSLDLCPSCQNESIFRERDKKDHKPSHPIIQLRRSLLRIELNPIMSQARYLLDNLSEEAARHCTACASELSERPYWCCTECEEEIFICTQCNDRFQKERPWLRQRRVGPLHDQFHTIVLYTEAAEESEAPLTTNERLAKLEEKLEARLDKQVVEIEASVAVRLQRLENMIERVIIAVTQAT